MNKEPDSWITINGQHVPIFEGEGKREAVSRFINKKISRVEKNKDKYDTISKFKKRKATNKIDKVKYNVSDDGNKYELDKAEREKVMQRLGRKTDNLKNFNRNEDGSKYIMNKEERDKVYKRLGIDKYSQGIEDYEKIGNTYIPVRKGESKENVVKDYKERERNIERIKELQDRDRALQSGIHTSPDDEKDFQEAQKNKGKLVDYNRRAKLMKFTQDNKDLIDKWVQEYDDETHKRVGEKVLRGEGLTAKEYFGFLGSDMKPGSIIGEEFPDGEDAIVANDGNWVRKSRIKEYNKNPKANQDAVYSGKDELEWERIEAEQFDKINRFRGQKQSNIKINNDEKEINELSKQLAREIYGKQISDEVAERYGKELQTLPDGAVLDDYADWEFDKKKLRWTKEGMQNRLIYLQKGYDEARKHGEEMKRKYKNK